VLTVTATYESWDFRWAYTVRYAEDYRLTIDQRHALLERSLAETRDAPRVRPRFDGRAVAAYVLGDLGASPPSRKSSATPKG
jgi:hypothetical protein